jgi:hypothetical protein
MDTDLVRSVARALRYRPLGHLVGRTVEVADTDHVEDALGPELPGGCLLAGPEPDLRYSAVARYGILDLRFTAPGELLAGVARGGVGLLRELGFLPGHRVCDDPTCLFLDGGSPATTPGSRGRTSASPRAPCRGRFGSWTPA